MSNVYSCVNYKIHETLWNGCLLMAAQLALSMATYVLLNVELYLYNYYSNEIISYDDRVKQILNSLLVLNFHLGENAIRITILLS